MGALAHNTPITTSLENIIMIPNNHRRPSILTVLHSNYFSVHPNNTQQRPKKYIITCECYAITEDSPSTKNTQTDNYSLRKSFLFYKQQATMTRRTADYHPHHKSLISFSWLAVFVCCCMSSGVVDAKAIQLTVENFEEKVTGRTVFLKVR